MRDEKFDEYYFDKKKHYPLPGESDDNRKSNLKHSKRPTKLSEDIEGGNLPSPGISDFSRSEREHSTNRDREPKMSRASDEQRPESETEPHGWYHGSEERPYQPNNLESEYYEHIHAREPGQAEINLYEDIMDKIMNTPDVNAQNVHIQVDQSRVILSGEVDTRKMREMIADIAKYTEGVGQVINDITVKRRS